MNATSRRLHIASCLLLIVGWAVCAAAEPDLTLVATAVGGLTLAGRWQRAEERR